ncbi:MAG TPA: ADP/ATP-dependent (S)-NAD(P)H-hydrate dehydratase [Candidatus Nanopelagicaceae bacterium]
MQSDTWKIWTAHDVRENIVAPSADDHKYSRGVLGVITGSNEYPGAAVLTCEAAMRTGLGMVRYFGPTYPQDLVLRQRPEVVTESGKVQAWLLGSGIDPENRGWFRTRAMRHALGQGLPVVLDAGALSLVTEAQGPTLITPHYRELHRLFLSRKISVTATAIEGDPKKWAQIAAKEFGVTVLLKGNVTVIASNENRIQLPASPTWLATAGTGDVLAGILGALIATQVVEIEKNSEALLSIAATGSFIHSRAAELASEGGPITAMDVAQNIPKVVAEFLLK